MNKFAICFSNESSPSNITPKFLAAGLIIEDRDPRCFGKIGMDLGGPKIIIPDLLNTFLTARIKYF